MSHLEKIQIELTSNCNEHCVHCYIPNDYRNHDMDSVLLRSVLYQCKCMGLEQIIFSGGEPMLHPDFLDAVDYANKYNFKIRIFSNLTLLNEEILTKLKMCQINLQEMQTSLYSVEPAIHDAITKVPGSCESTKKGIKKLAELGISVFISFPMTKLNKNSYLGVLTFAQQHGLNVAPDNIITAQSDGSGKNLKYRLNIAEALQVIRDILDNDTAYDDERFLPFYKSHANVPLCVQNICKNSLCVNSKGEVIPEPLWHRILGDLNKQTLRDIWEKSPEIQRLRNISMRGFPKCHYCSDIQFCGMSLGGNANENREDNPFIIPDYICVYARETRILVHSHHKINQRSRKENFFVDKK